MFNALDISLGRRLTSRSSGSLGVSCDEDGLFLGPDCALIERRYGRHIPRSPAELDRILMGAYGLTGQGKALYERLVPIASCLTRGEMAGAMIRSLLLGVPDLPDDTARSRLGRTWTLIKIGFDPNEPRDERGRWSTTAASKPPAALLTPASAKTRADDPKFAAFFRTHYPLAVPIAQKYGVDVSLLLGLAAHESGWGTNRQTREDYDPLGLTPNGRTSNHYGSLAKAWQDWGRLWGPRVQGIGDDASKFIDRLAMDNEATTGPTFGGDHRASYNPNRDDWAKKVAATIKSVRRRLPAWLGSGI